MKKLFLNSIAAIITLAGCSKTPTSNNSVNESLSLQDLKTFPKEWVYMFNITPDSVTADTRVLLYPDSSYWGTLTITQKGGQWIMKHLSYTEADSFEIKSCNRVIEAEMVYYNFELQKIGGADIKMQVNYRENEGNPQSSVFFFYDESDELSIFPEFISREFAAQMPVYITEGYD